LFGVNGSPEHVRGQLLIAEFLIIYLAIPAIGLMQVKIKNAIEVTFFVKNADTQ